MKNFAMQIKTMETLTFTLNNLPVIKFKLL